MTKVSEVRSALRHMALVKAAKPGSADKAVGMAARIRNGITGAVKPPLTGIGVGLNR